VETNFLIKLSNRLTEPIKLGSVSIYSLKEIHKDFWLQTNKAKFINFPEIESVQSEYLYKCINKKDVQLCKSRLEGFFDLNLSYETFFMRLVVSLLILFDENTVIVLNSVGLSSDLIAIENIFHNYLDGKYKALVIINSFA
jgi:hypothetical protein